MKRLLYIPAFILAVVLASPPKAVEAGGGVFFERHWSRPVQVLGSSHIKGPVLPKDCGACHADKLRDWSGSLHSKSVGPGLVSQLDPQKWSNYALRCYRCHAPAIEQSEVLEKDGVYVSNPAFDAKLKLTGVSCVVCHVRDGVVNGPEPSRTPPATPPHPMVIEKGFSSSRFCSACHQLVGGYELGGKPLVNTYAEWNQSPYPERGVTCQKCHMPGRAHLFRGIHDAETVKRGVEIKAVTVGTGEEAGARLTITNTGVGHFFPTYVTPLVVLRGFLVDRDGREIEGTRREEYVARSVTLDLSTENFDTRIAPLGSRTFEYRPADREGEAAAGVALEVRVFPDEFYNRLFKSSLARGAYTDKSVMEEALAQSERSEYLLFKKVFMNRDF